MPSVAVGNTAVTEVLAAGTSFTPASGAEMVVKIQAGTGGAVDIAQGAPTSRPAKGTSTNVASEITVLLDDSMSVKAFSEPCVVTGFVIDS